MNRDQQIRVAAVAALGVVLAVVIYVQLRPASVPAPAADGAAEGVVATLTVLELTESDVDVAALIGNLKSPVFIYEDINPGRDPMRSLAGLIGPRVGPGGEVVDVFQLSPAATLYEAERMIVLGIVGNDRGRAATVRLLRDEYVVTEGHRFDIGIRVKRITDDSVVLTIPMENEDQELTKKLRELPAQ